MSSGSTLKSASSDVYSESNVPRQDRDTLDLARAGKKQVLKRRFGLVSMTGFSCMLMITWEAMLVDFSLGLMNGGPAGLIYSYLLAWAGTFSVFLAMGELSSMIPTAGGQYHWVNILAPPRTKKFLSYVTGWATIMSWAAAATAVAFFTGTLIQAAVELNIDSYEPHRWQGTLIMWGALLLSVAIVTTLGQVLPALEVLLLLLHILGFFGTMIPLIFNMPSGHLRKERAGEIFGTFFNLGGWNTQTLSFFVGIQGNATAFLGTDGAIHMSEEVEKSSVNVARSMTYSVLINGFLGFAMLLSVLFSVNDIQQLTQSTSTYPFIQILAEGFGSKGGATVIVALIAFLNFASILGALSSSSRMIWSFARDRGPPGWKWLKQVDKRTSIPVHTTIVTALFAAVLSLINIPSYTAFQDVVSLVLEGFYLSYLLALSLLLYRRVRGEILEPDQGPSRRVNGDPGPDGQLYFWGPWRVRGWVGLLNNIFAVVYLLIVSFFSFWPATAKVTAATMNYSVLVIGTVMVGSVAWYLLQGRTQYSGPVVEVQIIEERLGQA